MRLSIPVVRKVLRSQKIKYLTGLGALLCWQATKIKRRDISRLLIFLNITLHKSIITDLSKNQLSHVRSALLMLSEKQNQSLLDDH